MGEAGRESSGETPRAASGTGLCGVRLLAQCWPHPRPPRHLRPGKPLSSVLPLRQTLQIPNTGHTHVCFFALPALLGDAGTLRPTVRTEPTAARAPRAPRALGPFSAPPPTPPAPASSPRAPGTLSAMSPLPAHAELGGRALHALVPRPGRRVPSPRPSDGTAPRSLPWQPVSLSVRPEHPAPTLSEH